MFGLEAFVVVLDDLPGGEADLVAVGRGARRRTFGDDGLRQFAGQGGSVGFARVGAAADAHGLIDVGAARERVADGATDAGRRPAVGLDFGGVVVGFVFELQQPRAGFAVFVHIHVNGAGVDFRRDFHVLQATGGAAVFGVNGGEFHQGVGAGSRRFAIDGFTLGAVVSVVGSQCLAEGAVREADVVQLGGEGGVAAVIRPVGVEDADFRFAGVAAFHLVVMLDVGKVGRRHGEAVRRVPSGETVAIQRAEAVVTRHGRCGVIRRQAGVSEVLFAAVDGVDEMGAQFFPRSVIQVAFKQPSGGAGDDGRREGIIQQTQALSGGIGALVVLPGQRLDDEGVVRFRQGVAGAVGHRVGENATDGEVEQSRRAVVEVIHREAAHPLQAGEVEAGFQAFGEGVVVGVFGAFFDVEALVHGGVL